MAGYVGVSWGPRPEDRDGCAQRISAFLLEIAIVDVTLSRWFKPARSRRKAVGEVLVDRASIYPLLKQNRTDFGKQVIDELGFGFHVWNGGTGGIDVSLILTCGCYSKYVANSLAVSFGPGIPPDLDKLIFLLRKAVESFQPDRGRVTYPVADANNSSDERTVYSYGRNSGFST